MEKLGAEIVVSGKTNQEQVSMGSSLVISDTCLPVKVFMGHVLSLRDKCDKLLIPVVQSTSKKAINCSMFMALPDLTKAVVPNVPPILEIEFDYSRGKRYLYRQICALGKNFTFSTFKIKEAAEYAWQQHQRYHQIMVQQHITREEAIPLLCNGKTIEVKPAEANALTIGIAGHPYVLYDQLVSHNLIKRLRAAGVTFLTPEMAPETCNSNYNNHPGLAGLADNYWEAGEDVVGAVSYYTHMKVDGIIGIMAFGCAPDSLMMDVIQRRRILQAYHIWV